MKKIIILCSVLLISALGYSQKTIYQSDSFETLSSNHKTVAIIPFEARLELKNKELTDEQVEELF